MSAEAASRGIRPLVSVASGSRAPAGDPHPRLQVVPGPGRGAPRAGRGRRGRAERLREVERRRRAPLGIGLAEPARAARGEAGRRALRRASGRPPADFCEVELLFDNSDGALAELDFTEVSVARRLHRGGEGQYLVNRAHVRRTDLVELLADAGLGGSHGSVISQGKVEEILASKPEERRVLLEDAAGLGQVQAAAAPGRAEARARAGSGRARARPRGRGQDAAAAARAPGERRRAGREAARRDRGAAGAARTAGPRSS